MNPLLSATTRTNHTKKRISPTIETSMSEKSISQRHEKLLAEHREFGIKLRALQRECNHPLDAQKTIHWKCKDKVMCTDCGSPVPIPQVLRQHRLSRGSSPTH